MMKGYWVGHLRVACHIPQEQPHHSGTFEPITAAVAPGGASSAVTAPA